MSQPIQPPAHRPTRRAVTGTRLLLLVVAVGMVAGCAGKTAAQRATDELNAGLTASSQGRNDDAATYYTNCVQLDPTNKFCIYNLGVIAQGAGRIAEAENEYRLALLIDPEFSAPMYNLAIIRAAVGSGPEAIELYRRFLQRQPDVAEAHLRLSVLLRQAGDNAGADRELAEAVRLNPGIAAPSASP